MSAEVAKGLCLAATHSGALCAAVLAFFLTGCGGPKLATVHGKSFEHWLHALHEPDVRIRKKAVESLANVGTADPAVIPALIETLDDRDAGVRGAAVLALLKIGSEAGEAVPALRKTLQDKNATVRSYAAKALERIEGPDYETRVKG